MSSHIKRDFSICISVPVGMLRINFDKNPKTLEINPYEVL